MANKNGTLVYVGEMYKQERLNDTIEEQGGFSHGIAYGTSNSALAALKEMDVKQLSSIDAFVLDSVLYDKEPYIGGHLTVKAETLAAGIRSIFKAKGLKEVPPIISRDDSVPSRNVDAVLGSDGYLLATAARAAADEVIAERAERIRNP